MTRDELQNLISLLLDGSLSDAQLSALSDYLRDHADAQQQLVDLLCVDSLLADELGTVSVAGLVDMVGAQPVAELTKVPNEVAYGTLASSATRARTPRWVWAATMAAAILLGAVSVAVIIHFWNGGSSAIVEHDDPNAHPTAAEIVELHALELVNAQGEATAAVAGAQVKPGLTLRTTGDEGFAVLKSNGSARFELLGDTTARLVAEPTAEGGKRLFLSQGVMRVAAARKQGSRLTVSTPHAAIQVDGTLLCSTTPDATYVEVEAGRMRLVRQADGQKIELTDGFSVVAASDINPMVTRAVAPTLTTPLHVLKKAGAVTLAFSADSSALTTADAGAWRVWDPKTGQLKATHTMPPPELANAALSRDARLLAGSGKGGVARLINLTTGEPLITIPTGGKEIRAVGIAPDGSVMATAEPDRNRSLLRLFDGTTGMPRRMLRVPAHVVRSLGFSSDAVRLAMGTQKGTVYIAEVAGDQEPAALAELGSPVAGLAFAPDSRHLAAVGVNGAVVIFDLVTRSETHRFQISGRSFLSLAYSPAGRYLAAGTRDGTITLWNAASGAEELTLKAQAGAVRTLAYSPDGTLLAAGTPRPTFVWRLPDHAVDPLR